MRPEGYYPIGGRDAGWEGCAPLPGGPEQESDEPEPKWATRWGAVATTNGVFGFSHSWTSEEQAVEGRFDIGPDLGTGLGIACGHGVLQKSFTGT